MENEKNMDYLFLDTDDVCNLSSIEDQPSSSENQQESFTSEEQLSGVINFPLSSDESTGQVQNILDARCDKLLNSDDIAELQSHLVFLENEEEYSSTEEHTVIKNVPLCSDGWSSQIENSFDTRLDQIVSEKRIFAFGNFSSSSDKGLVHIGKTFNTRDDQESDNSKRQISTAENILTSSDNEPIEQIDASFGKSCDIIPDLDGIFGLEEELNLNLKELDKYYFENFPSFFSVECQREIDHKIERHLPNPLQRNELPREVIFVDGECQPNSLQLFTDSFSNEIWINMRTILKSSAVEKKDDSCNIVEKNDFPTTKDQRLSSEKEDTTSELQKLAVSNPSSSLTEELKQIQMSFERRRRSDPLPRNIEKYHKIDAGNKEYSTTISCQYSSVDIGEKSVSLTTKDYMLSSEKHEATTTEEQKIAASKSPSSLTEELKQIQTTFERRRRSDPLPRKTKRYLHDVHTEQKEYSSTVSLQYNSVDIAEKSVSSATKDHRLSSEKQEVTTSEEQKFVASNSPSSLTEELKQIQTTSERRRISDPLSIKLKKDFSMADYKEYLPTNSCKNQPFSHSFARISPNRPTIIHVVKDSLAGSKESSKSRIVGEKAVASTSQHKQGFSEKWQQSTSSEGHIHAAKNRYLYSEPKETDRSFKTTSTADLLPKSITYPRFQSRRSQSPPNTKPLYNHQPSSLRNCPYKRINLKDAAKRNEENYQSLDPTMKNVLSTAKAHSESATRQSQELSKIEIKSGECANQSSDRDFISAKMFQDRQKITGHASNDQSLPLHLIYNRKRIPAILRKSKLYQSRSSSSLPYKQKISPPSFHNESTRGDNIAINSSIGLKTSAPLSPGKAEKTTDENITESLDCDSTFADTFQDGEKNHLCMERR